MGLSGLSLNKKILYLVSGLLLLVFVIVGFFLSNRSKYRTSSDSSPSYYIISEEIIPLSSEGVS